MSVSVSEITQELRNEATCKILERMTKLYPGRDDQYLRDIVVRFEKDKLFDVYKDVISYELGYKAKVAEITNAIEREKEVIASKREETTTTIFMSALALGKEMTRENAVLIEKNDFFDLACKYYRVHLELSMSECYEKLYHMQIPKYHFLHQCKHRRKWFKACEKEFTGAMKQCRIIYWVLILDKELCKSFANHPLFRLMCVLPNKWNTGTCTFVLDKAKVREIESLTTGESPNIFAMRFLVKFNTHCRNCCNLPQAYKYVSMIRTKYPNDRVHYDVLKWCCFFGLGTKQSYEGAIQCGVEPRLCATGVNADFHLLPVVKTIIIRRYLDTKTLLSLRLVCKLWNRTILSHTEFWTRFKGSETHDGTSDLSYAVMTNGASIRVHLIGFKILEKKSELKKTQRYVEYAEEQLQKAIVNVDNLKRQLAAEEGQIDDLQREGKMVREYIKRSKVKDNSE